MTVLRGDLAVRQSRALVMAFKVMKDYIIETQGLASQFEETKAKYEAVTAEIQMRGIRRREFGRFITEIEKMPGLIKDFDEALTSSEVGAFFKLVPRWWTPT